MKLLLLSIAGGVVIPLILLTVTFIMMHVLELTRLEPFAYMLLVAVIWPLKLFDRLFPPQGMAFGPTNEALIGTAVCTMLFYSVVTYGVLWWRAKRRRLP